MDDFADRLVVITGGADGIGLALGESFAQRKMRVAILDIREDAAMAAAVQLTSHGVEARGFGCDVSDSGAVPTVAALIADTMGKPAIICANAGVGAAGGMLSAGDRAIDWVMAVNLHGTLASLRSLVPLLDPSGPRRVCVTASSASLVAPGAALGLYGGSKHCTMGVAEAVAEELAPEGIPVTILCPGLINTRIWDGARARPVRFGGARLMPEETGERWRLSGMPADWVAEVAVDAIVAGARYCMPVDVHSQVEFEARIAAMSGGFRLWQDRDRSRWPEPA